MASVASSQPAEVPTVEFEVLGLCVVSRLGGSCLEGIHRGCRFRGYCEDGTFERARCTVDGFG